jgi:hypothetical protein
VTPADLPVDLLAARERRLQKPYHFANGADGCEFQLGRIDALLDYLDGVLLADAVEVARQVEQLASITRALRDAHIRRRGEERP